MSRHTLRILSLILLLSICILEMAIAKITQNKRDYDYYFSEGERAMEVSDYIEAEDSYAKALRFRPEDLRLNLRYAQALYNLKRYKESISYLKKVIQVSPNNIIARIYLAENYMCIDSKEAAKEQLEWVIRVQPNHSEAKKLYKSLCDEDLKEYKKVKGTDEKTIQKGEIVKEEKKTVASESGDLYFTPYVKGEKADSASQIKEKPVMPEARKDIEDTSLESFFSLGQKSFVVMLEKARYEIEKGKLDQAFKTVELAEKLAIKSKKKSSILEAQVFKSLLYIYQCRFNEFGKLLMNLKNVLPQDYYLSFLNVFTKSNELQEKKALRRLAAGVAAGAGHYPVVVSLLEPIFKDNPEELAIAVMLAEAQMSCSDFDGAENTLKKISELNPEGSEIHFYLARFYLTAKYNALLVKKHGEIAARLNPSDKRIGVVLGLADYAEGKVSEGIKRIKELMPSIENSPMKEICQKIIEDGEAVKVINEKENPYGLPDVPEVPSLPSTPAGLADFHAKKIFAKDFIGMLALPGSKNASQRVNRLAAEDMLKSGSYFTAIEEFSKTDDFVEMGRSYFALASSLVSEKEIEMAAIAAGYGAKLIMADMKRNRHHMRGYLYLGLYDYERKAYEDSMRNVLCGMKSSQWEKEDDYMTKRDTFKRLVSLRDNLKFFLGLN